jgi:NAD(P)-dependent dehydrogenase (short-subunit alcohol dehydrogenase family)
MLDFDLDLEADLGVDTVKQAEIFVALRETYGISRDDTLKLRDFPTLAHVVGFVLDRAGGGHPAEVDQATPAESIATPAEAPPTTVVEPPAGSQSTDDGASDLERRRPTRDAHVLTAGLDAADAVTRRVPVPVLRPPLDVCATTGIGLEAGARVAVMADSAGTAKELVVQLERLGVDCLLVDDAPTAEELTRRIEAWREGRPVDGVYWLPALDHATPGDLAAWREALRVRVKLLFAAMRAAAAGSATEPFLVAATRLGGFHGYDETGAADVLGGGVTGFTKAYHREAPSALAKAVDVEVETAPEEVASRLIQETMWDPGVVEVGYAEGLRWSVGVEERKADAPDPETSLGPTTTFVVTGAAGSIVSAIVADLATATGGTFHLLDLAPTPDPQDPDLVRFAEDREGLKRDLFARITARGDRATPALVEKELAGLERRQAAVAAMEAVRAAGGTAHYHQVDLTTSGAMAAMADQIAAEGGHVDVLVHAAGLEVSHLLADKEQREFDLVFDVKADGLFNVLQAFGGPSLRAVVVFSSIAGRFGNAGQTDYSAANDLLCKAMSNLRRTSPATRGIAIDWTAWAGIGMASRGSIPTMMAMAGIDMLPPEAGIPVVRRELLAGTNQEVVVGDRLGVLMNDPDLTTGLDLGGWALSGPMAARVVHIGLARPLETEALLDPMAEPFLDDHRIEGVSVLPGVMGLEAFAEVAAASLPGWRVAALEDVQFLAPFKFYRDQPRVVTVRATFARDDREIVASCSLIGRRDLPGLPGPQEVTHFTGRVRLTRDPGEQRTVAVDRPSGGSIGSEDLYRVFFHGPSYQVLDRAWVDASGATGEMASGLPEDLREGVRPAIAPRVIELAFQTAAVWEIAEHQRLALPRSVARISLGTTPPGVSARATVAVRTPSTFDVDVVDGAGAVLARLEGYETVELPGALDTQAAEAFRSGSS